MDDSPTELRLPQTFPYPIKVVSIDAASQSSVQRGARLLTYSFVYLPLAAKRDQHIQPETRFGTWDSSVEGTITSWNIKAGDVISQNKASRPVVVVNEPCKHGMQIGGLCALCGKDMTNLDYTEGNDTARASIQMTHSAFGPTVSFEEAQRIERETANRLLKSKKLSLIVDLDQTIVHATVDPTVGEWIAEGEAWETRQAKKASTTPGSSDDSDEDSDSEDEECNPNWEALKDVKKFRLGPDSFGAGPQQKGKGKNKLVENEGCMYYIKPRPGWKEFLQEAATKYEMHVYTMGTRAYAEEVCAAIDPDGSIFGGRLLSRDESGSLTQKSLRRLFPCDTSMVVIIDDRADVWEWSPNLLKVVPYDFFVGIGDINSSFLPKIQPMTVSSTVPKPVPDKPSTSSEKSTPEEIEAAEKVATAMLTQNNAALEAQLEQRPLAKKQEELQIAEGEKVQHEKEKERTQTPEQPPETSSDENKEETASPSPKPEKVARKALLKNDDYELDRVGKLLDEVHRRFFKAYEERTARAKHISTLYDVTKIIPSIRSEVFEGVNILFSSVIPLDTDPEKAEVWQLAYLFGGKCSVELTKDVTHVVAAKRGTVKVDMARKRRGVKIVWVSWFQDSVATWKRQDETPYLLDEPVAGSSTSPVEDVHQISSDPEPDADDWDIDPFAPIHDVPVGNVDWGDATAEVMAELGSDADDSDEDDAMSTKSEDYWTEEANSGVSNDAPRFKRKRLRSLTPSSDSLNGSIAVNDDTLRSPLAKRKKLAAERFGDSRMKEAITADDLGPKAGSSSQPSSRPTSEANGSTYGDEDEEEDEEGDEDEDDFLARELEEEWG
ncbi:hypothetical protein BDQ12DRAFT_677487 [Crucibulum laeve]|uniref:RNA polymerase II subunit A C-terminal domain phosphatase n=1 Tax=Crucibulum laeve TaxID=68775 RepID=A0A5C3MAS2_9AGAR|nr:hypothetical protein BDQ12DRAFT_677487 [Crucibulum laeve]